MQTKHCLKCGKHKSFLEFNKDKTKKDGLQTHCKLCRAQTNCDKAREYAKQYRQTHREKLREYAQQYRQTNRDKTLEYCRQWRKANRDKTRKSAQEYRQTNPDKARQSIRKWREANTDKRNALEAKRRAAKLQRTPHWLTKDQLDEIETFYTVALAFRLFTGLTYHVDHIVPLQGKNVSGLHVPWNLRVIPETDNLKKSNSFED